MHCHGKIILTAPGSLLGQNLSIRIYSRKREKHSFSFMAPIIMRHLWIMIRRKNRYRTAFNFFFPQSYHRFDFLSNNFSFEFQAKIKRSFVKEDTKKSIIKLTIISAYGPYWVKLYVGGLYNFFSPKLPHTQRTRHNNTHGHKDLCLEVDSNLFRFMTFN